MSGFFIIFLLMAFYSLGGYCNFTVSSVYVYEKFQIDYLFSNPPHN